MIRAASRIVPPHLALEAQRVELAGRIARSVDGDGIHATAIGPLSLIRASSPSQPLPSVYQPSLCVVVQGRKQALLGDDTYTYDPLHYLVVSMTLPVVGQVTEASEAHPYLCLRIDIDVAQLNDLQPPAEASAATPTAQERAMFLARTDAPMLDAVLRLVRLLDAPAEIPVLAPLALREIHYRALTGELGHRLRALCAVDGPSQRIARAIELLRTRYAEPLRIDALAEAAHMSPSSLHARFKAATAMSPLQFQKKLRLQEARRMMLVEGLEAAAAGHRVGYGSPSQFSREYRRLFGTPPRREIDAMRAAAG